MTKPEAERSLSGSIELPIEGIPLGVSFSDDQYSKWSESVRQSLDVDQILRHEPSIAVSQGDANTLTAWVECMNRRGGLGVYIEPISPTEAVVRISWNAFKNKPDEKITMTADGTIIGATATFGADALKAGAVLEPEKERIVVVTKEADSAVQVVVRSSMGDTEAYLPRPQKLPPIAAPQCTLRSEVSRDGQCESSDWVYIGPHAAPAHWGTCMNAAPCTISARPVLDRTCTAEEVYVGVNLPDRHGGHCVRLNNGHRIATQVVKTQEAKDCGPGWAYAGPNMASMHWGMCIRAAR